MEKKITEWDKRYTEKPTDGAQEIPTFDCRCSCNFHHIRQCEMCKGWFEVCCGYKSWWKEAWVCGECIYKRK